MATKKFYYYCIILHHHKSRREKDGHMSVVSKKSVFRVFDLVILNNTCMTEGSENLNIKARVLSISSKQRTLKVLVIFGGCTGWSVSLLFRYAKTGRD